MNVLNLYPVYYNVTIHKCHIPVQVGVDIATTDFQWSRTFEGNQTVPIQVANLPLAVSFIGSPYAHVEVNRVAGGIMMSAALWFKDSSGHWSTEKVPIVDRQKIPLDTSDCQSNGIYTYTYTRSALVVSLLMGSCVYWYPCGTAISHCFCFCQFMVHHRRTATILLTHLLTVAFLCLSSS